jgi:hypothetical protein
MVTFFQVIPPQAVVLLHHHAGMTAAVMNPGHSLAHAMGLPVLWGTPNTARRIA